MDKREFEKTPNVLTSSAYKKTLERKQHLKQGSERLKVEIRMNRLKKAEEKVAN